MKFEVQPTVYVDGSGAPCVIEHKGFSFACDYLKGVKLSLLGGSDSVSSKRATCAASEVRSFYSAWVQRETSEGWLNANFMMYTD